MRHFLTRLPFLTAAIALVALGSVAIERPAFAQSAVKATVNDQPVTSFDVDQRVKLMKLFHQPDGGAKQVLENLIDEQLAGSAAAMRKIGPTDDMVNDRFNAIAKQVKLPPDKFVAALKHSGVEAATLKKFIRAQITWGMILQARARAAKVSETDIQNEIVKEGIPTQEAKIQEFMLQQIVFVVPKGSPPGLTAQRQRDAESFRKQFTSCSNSLALAKTMKGVVVLDMGRRDSTQIPPQAVDQMKTITSGGTIKPEVSDRGVEVIAVCSVRDVNSMAGIHAQVQSKLAEAATKDQDKTFKAELRKNAKIVYN